MGGRLGNETYIDLLVSSALSPPIFTLIGNDDFYTNLVLKSWGFWVVISRRDRVGLKNVHNFSFTFFSRICNVVSGLGLVINKETGLIWLLIILGFFFLINHDHLIILVVCRLVWNTKTYMYIFPYQISVVMLKPIRFSRTTETYTLFVRVHFITGILKPLQFICMAF